MKDAYKEYIMGDTEEFTGEATYCPEDNKLRLYVGWVSREEYDELRKEGWTATPKQDCDFVAVWTPGREDTALKYAGVIGDEDVSPQERAVDRAERFAGYRDKRLSEAVGHADRYDGQPSVHGFQSQDRAERSARRHDRIADRSLSSWDKADYWVSRTNGVIQNALYKSTPGVRMGRIKEIEKEKRKAEKSDAEYRERYKLACDIAADPEDCFNTFRKRYPVDDESDSWVVGRIVGALSGWRKFPHPRVEGYSGTLYDLATHSKDPVGLKECVDLWLEDSDDPDSPEYQEVWFMRMIRHCDLRLAYENQMLEAVGGMAAMVEMEVGGWIGSYQIRRVNKSRETGRVVSVGIKQRGTQYDSKAPGFYIATVNIERFKQDIYRAPTEADIESLKKEIAEEKAAKPKVKSIPFINPTLEDAERLQAIWNERRDRRWNNEESKVVQCTQKAYSQHSKGSYSHCETKLITGGGFVSRAGWGYMNGPDCPTVAKVRTYSGSVVVLKDKPQKPFPKEVWNDPRPAMRAEVESRIEELARIMCANSLTDEIMNHELVEKARTVRLAKIDSMSQFGLTDAGNAILQKIYTERRKAENGSVQQVA